MSSSLIFPRTPFKLVTKARVTESFLVTASCIFSILKSFSFMLSKDLSRFSAPFWDRVVRFPILFIKSWLLAFKNLFCSFNVSKEAKAASFSSSQAFILIVVVSNKLFVFCWSCSSSVNFFCDTQEAKKTVSIRVTAFFISMIFKILYKLTQIIIIHLQVCKFF